MTSTVVRESSSLSEQSLSVQSPTKQSLTSQSLTHQNLRTVLARYPNQTPEGTALRHPNLYAQYVLGAAFFDLDGLSRTCINAPDMSKVSWVQTTFEALRLQSLLGCWLKLRGVEHIMIRGRECQILLVRQRDRYLGLLIKQDAPDCVVQALTKWAKEGRRSATVL
jgi:hypothetical protein